MNNKVHVYGGTDQVNYPCQSLHVLSSSTCIVNSYFAFGWFFSYVHGCALHVSVQFNLCPPDICQSFEVVDSTSLSLSHSDLLRDSSAFIWLLLHMPLQQPHHTYPTGWTHSLIYCSHYIRSRSACTEKIQVQLQEKANEG